LVWLHLQVQGRLRWSCGLLLLLLCWNVRQL